jgi:hypothetical protein
MIMMVHLGMTLMGHQDLIKMAHQDMIVVQMVANLAVVVQMVVDHLYLY